MNKKVIYGAVAFLVLAGGAYGAKVYIDQNKASADVLIGQTIDENSTAVFRVNTGATQVTQGVDVDFTVNLDNVDQWPGFSKKGDVNYILAGKIFDSQLVPDAQQDEVMNEGGKYNFVQYLNPSYSTDSPFVKTCIDRGRDGRCNTYADIISLKENKFTGILNNSYKIKATIPQSITTKDGKVATKFDLYVCNTRLNYDNFFSKKDPARYTCNVTKDGKGHNSKKVAQSNIVVQQVTQDLKIADLAVTDIRGDVVTGYRTSNTGVEHREPVIPFLNHVYTVPRERESSSFYIAVGFKNKQTGSARDVNLNLFLSSLSQNQQNGTYKNLFDVEGGWIFEKPSALDLPPKDFRIFNPEYKINMRSYLVHMLTKDSKDWRYRVDATGLKPLALSGTPDKYTFSVSPDPNARQDKMELINVRLGDLSGSAEGVVVFKLKAKPTYPSAIGSKVNGKATIFSRVSGNADGKDADPTNNLLQSPEIVGYYDNTMISTPSVITNPVSPELE